MADKTSGLSGGSYEILKNRLDQGIRDLKKSLNGLNDARRQAFGSIEQKLLATERIHTDHNCIPQDMIAVAGHMLFGFNVHLGLKSNVDISDVLAIYSYRDHTFHAEKPDLINDSEFISDFHKLYKYYKETSFAKFAKRGPFLYMIFRIGKTPSDIKAFKWQINADSLTYIDNRSEHEFSYPSQHDFKWKKATRDDQRHGKFPHVSIADKVFVETVGGDLTIKIEDNTDSGQGIYQEEVENKDQTLDDADIFYAIYGSLVILKIKPYQEKEFRYIVYNEKLQAARKIPAIENACIFLPDDQGILFSNGYYLQSGDYKLLETGNLRLMFEKKLNSPNGEDFLYVFYEPQSGRYLLLPFNIIQRQISTPISCHGFALFGNGELAYFNGDDVPKKHHVVKIWQTPFTDPDFEVVNTEQNSYLVKIGNRDIVRAMAECQEIITVADKGEDYEGIYNDLLQRTTDIIDSYHWLNHEEAFQIGKPLAEIRDTSKAAIEEFEKVIRIQRETKKQTEQTLTQVYDHISKVSRESSHSLEKFVKNLSVFRQLMGDTESLRKLRYSDPEQIDRAMEDLKKGNDSYAAACVRFLLRPEALDAFKSRISEFEGSIEKVKKVVDAREMEARINELGHDLELLIEVVGNLEINDATQTTQIIENISALFAQVNQHRANLRKRQAQLSRGEAQAEFNVQIKLIEQGLTNYLDLCDTPAKCDEYLAKLLVQVEELESRFGEFDEFLEKISVYREQVLDAFEAKKNVINESLNRRRQAILQSGLRILQSIEGRVMKMQESKEIEAYFTADLMPQKLRKIIDELLQLEDPVKADDLQSRLKSTRDEALRQLRDRKELYTDGKDVIKLGPYQFTVNEQPLELSIIPRQDSLYFHLGGTNFYEEVNDPFLLENRHHWDQLLISENSNIYRSEFLAFQLLKTISSPDATVSVNEVSAFDDSSLLSFVQQQMASRYNEGYAKGIHDHDTVKILKALITFYKNAGTLRYDSKIRAWAVFAWQYQVDPKITATWTHRLKTLGQIYALFGNRSIFSEATQALIPLLGDKLSDRLEEHQIVEAASYLIDEISANEAYVLSREARSAADGFTQVLGKKKALKAFETSLKDIDEAADKFQMIRSWLLASVPETHRYYLEEAAVYLMNGSTMKESEYELETVISDLKGSHPRIGEDSTMKINFNWFFDRLSGYMRTGVPVFENIQKQKQFITRQFSDKLRLDSFKPRVMSSFVRNKLINDVYLPLIGANLAKQMGEAGANKRTDLMGMLLLVSPPGYGKTTLMEYIANRLGLIFMKINGPSIGHEVTNLDPEEAGSATARQELEKLNLAFEMGDNIMLYIDDIQHLSAEFLQKFISLCDAQRKIEGVYKGRTKTYDFRGRKVCVVMAGNPYTESGEKFKIPDMLSNRADIYNLGDITGNSEEAFKLSYLENSMTSNTALQLLSGKSQNDFYRLVSDASNGLDRPSEQLEGNYSPDEITDAIAVIKKLMRVRDVIMMVNNQYVKSAAQADEYRTEPSFKLQGSYRDMNKIAEKVFPVMNDEELETLIRSHYQNEAQSLTTDAEANLLKFNMLCGWMSKEEEKRWEFICETFMKQQKRKGYGDHQTTGMLLENMTEIAKSLDDIGKALRGSQ